MVVDFQKTELQHSRKLNPLFLDFTYAVTFGAYLISKLVKFEFLIGETVFKTVVAQLIKNPPAVWEIWVQFLGWEDPLEKGMTTHTTILDWRIPWTV